MMARSIVSFTISPNSSKAFFSPGALVKMMPTPSMNDRRRAVSISQIGGNLILK